MRAKKIPSNSSAENAGSLFLGPLNMRTIVLGIILALAFPALAQYRFPFVEELRAKQSLEEKIRHLRTWTPDLAEGHPIYPVTFQIFLDFLLNHATENTFDCYSARYVSLNQFPINIEGNSMTSAMGHRVLDDLCRTTTYWFVSTYPFLRELWAKESLEEKIPHLRTWTPDMAEGTPISQEAFGRFLSVLLSHATEEDAFDCDSARDQALNLFPTNGTEMFMASSDVGQESMASVVGYEILDELCR